MADEIIQAIDFEIKGVKMAFDVAKYGLEGAVQLARLLASFIKYGSGKLYDKYQNRAGCRSISDMMKLTNGRTKVIEVNEEYLNKIIDEAENKKLHFAFPVDLNPNDKMKPIMIPEDEADVFMAMINGYKKQYDEELNANLVTYVDQKKELEEKLRKTIDEVEKADLESQINNLDRAIEEGKALMNYTTDVKDVNSYLRAAEGTEFEKNPEFAAILQERGVSYSVGEARDIFVPIRNEKAIPDSKWSVYVPEVGARIERKFEIDESTKIVYSTYSFKTLDGEIKTFSDKNHTYDSWNNEVLGKFLDEAGILEGSKVCVFNNGQDVAAYKSIAEKLKNKDLAQETLENIVNKLNEKGASKETINEMYGIFSELKKNRDSEAISGDTYSLTCNIKDVSQENGKLKVDLGDNIVMSFSNIHVAKKNSDGTYTFNFDNKCNPSRINFVDGKTSSVKLAMDDAVKLITESSKKAVLTSVNKAASK